MSNTFNILLFILFTFLPLHIPAAKTPPPNFKVTNEMIYQQLMELREEHAVFKEKFKQIDKRFEQIDKRLEELKADTNKRFEELKADTNKRFEELKTDTNKRFEELRADTNKRFEELRADINKRFDDLFHYLNILAAIFTTFTVSVLAFAYWDRRTIIAKAKEETVREIENSGRLISVLRERARTDRELERILKEHKLL